MTWFLLALAICLEVGATLCLRASEGLTRRVWIAPIAAGYLGSLGALGFALSRGLPIGVAYGIWAACGVALTAVAGRALFGDRISRLTGLGTVLVIIGVVLVESAGHNGS